MAVSTTCLVSNQHGRYVPSAFITNYDLTNDGITGWFDDRNPDRREALSAEDRAILADADHEYYDETWCDVNQCLYHIDKEGNHYDLHTGDNGDLFAYCEKLMTPQEYYEWFDEPKPHGGYDFWLCEDCVLEVEGIINDTIDERRHQMIVMAIIALEDGYGKLHDWSVEQSFHKANCEACNALPGRRNLYVALGKPEEQAT